MVLPEGVPATAAARSRRAPPAVMTTRKPAPAESGRPEAEFAKRIHCVILRVRPPEQQEGATPTPVDTRRSVPTRLDTEAPEVAEPDDRVPPGPAAAPQDKAEPVEARSGRLVDHIAAVSDGIHLKTELRGQYEEDGLFKAVLESPKQHKNFIVLDGLVFLRERGCELLCIPNVIIRGRSAWEIGITHAHSLLAHLGTSKTASLLRDHVWWKTLATDVQKYCDTCVTCKQSKAINQKPYGLLNPLPLPAAPWEAIRIDFVGPLPESNNRDGTFDAITTIIDLLTGMVHLVPSRTNYKAKDVVELVFAEVYRHHGLPRSIISDRDVLFTSAFWAHLHKLIGVELRMSSAYHPESDGSTERANRTISQMLRQCVGPSQRDWVAKLPAIEFAINMARSESTGHAPFFLNTGRMPRPLIWEHAKPDDLRLIMPVISHLNQNLSVLPNGDILMRSPAGPTHLYSPAQVRLFLEFDTELHRTMTFNEETTPVPGGYDDFQSLWNLDGTSQYRVALVDTEVITAEGVPVPEHLLIPNTPIGDVNTPLRGGLPGDEANLFRRMLVNAAERDQRNQETARVHYQEHVVGRGRKETTCMREAPMRGSACTMGVLDTPAPAPKRLCAASLAPTTSGLRSTPAGVLSGSTITAPQTTSAAAEDVHMADVTGLRAAASTAATMSKAAFAAKPAAAKQKST
ncbi:Transposon Ty3-I Gag-Pol polyprotein [Trametes pubescens]|uniref:Transposon Ty3-I Gag-Pol polyprotein n=1 Tax=Trametes pubescens TaxID=154538 RepID=A0A1M2V7X6_TRAPU|nr:Transposon Ty3-I Gag-Pol polyprotein [Trametes pubescens]